MAAGSTVRGNTISKANDNDDLDQVTSWVGGVVPTNSDVVTWNSTVAGPNTTLLATNATWAGLKISNPGGLVTINSTSTNATAGATLTLGASGLDMSAASQDLTLGAPVALLGDTTQNWILGAGHTLTLNGGLVRNARATLSIDNTSGGMMTVPVGPLSTGLSYITLDGTDFGALDGSGNLAPASSVVAFTQNPSTTTANGASLRDTQTWIDVVNSNPLNGPSAFRLSSTLTTSGGVRFNAPNTLGVNWVVDANSRNFNLNGASILITSNVGPQNVIFQDSATGIRLPTSGEVMFSQQNPFGDFIINGHISQSTGSGANVTKTGVGRVIYGPASGISYGGLTDIEQGTLLVDSSISSSQVNVNSGATLAGAGSVNAVAVAAGGTIAPGDTNFVGTLTVGGPLTLNGGSALNFYGPTLPTTNSAALLNLTNTLTLNGTVNVSILSGSAVAGQYPLIKWTNAIDGATFAQFNLVFLPPHSGGYLSNNVQNSSIDLVITNVNEPITWATGSGAWDINTSVNWRDAGGNPSVFQQNGSLADSVVFEDTLSGASPITVTLNANVVPPTTLVNASKNYTITGTGGIGGVGSLTKAGSGTLTLGTVNSFKGGINLNGGTTVFSSLANIGNGVINFNGGTLQYVTGNFDDLSTRIVAFGAGGAGINDGGNTLSFANPIGNGGAGGFTKSGSGNLTLSGTNGYSGNTVVSQGTLTLAYQAYISNSASIVINSGATLDDSQNGGMVLGTTVGQTLSGNGTLSGGLTVPTGTTVSPGGNGTVGTLNEANGDVTFTGGTYVCDIASASSRDLLNITGNLTLTSGKLQLNVTGTLANGSYKLIQYSGTLLSNPGSSANLTISGFSQAGKAATLSDAVAGEIDLVISDTANDALTWTGNNGSTWDLAATLNWVKGATPWAFTNGDSVTLDDSTANGTVMLQAAVKPGSVTVNNNTTPYTLMDGTGTGAGKISGATGLTKNGTGTLVLDTLNDNSGTVAINGGTLQVGDGSNTGNIGTGNVTDNASLVFAQTDARTVAGAISGSGTLTQQGSSTLTLAQNNTYSGGTTISSGTLQVGTGGSTGTLGSAGITNNGTLVFNRSGSVAVNNGITGSGAVTFNGTATVTVGGVNSYTGTTSVGGGTTVKPGSAGVIPETPGTINGKLDLNGFDQAFDRLNGSGTIVNDAGTGTNNLVIDYDGNGTADSSVVIADNDGTGGKVAVVKTGIGSQILRGLSTYTGGTIVSNGNLNLRGKTTPLGAGPVILRGGSLSFIDTLTLPNAIIAETNATLDTPGSANYTLTGDITTSSNLTFVFDAAETVTLNGSATQLNGVTGTIVLSGTSGFFRFQGSQGSPNATFDMTGSTVTISSKDSGSTIQLGALVGDTTPFLGAASGSTFVIGGKNLSTEFDGTFNSATSNNIVKVGTGTLTLGGYMGFTGNVTVSNGVLALTNSLTLDNNSGIAVNSGGKLDMSGIGGTLNLGNSVNQTLTGGGTVLGSVTATGGAVATINPGDGIGALNITNVLTLAGNTVVTMELNRTNAGATNDMIVAGSIVPNGATLNVTNLGSYLLNNDTFKLFNHPVSGFGTIVLPSTDSTGTSTYVWKTNLDVDGSITLLSGGTSPVNTTPTNLVYQVSGGQLTLSWPADHTGWRLQAQTNTPGGGLTSTNWYDVPGASSTDTVTVPINPTNGPVFYRMVYP